MNMLRRSGAFSLGRVFGIPIYVDFSWLVIFFLITLTISQGFAREHPDWLPAQSWAAGVITCLVFFLCVLLHEMGHSLVAKSFGLPVLSITLFIFGGVAQIKNEPRKPSHEFLIAIAGPLTSLLLSAVFFLLAGTADIKAVNLPMFRVIVLWLAWINLSLAIFNMIPGFPLDGGRVLRSIVWRLTGKFELATRFAAGLGTLIAYFFIVGGIYLAFSVHLQGLWIAFIGWFLLMAARGSLAQMETRRALEGLRVANIVEQLPLRVSPGMSIQGLVDGPILQHGQRTFIVEDDGVLCGLVTLHEVKSVPRGEWANTPLQTVMVPAGELVVAEPDQPLLSVMEIMDQRGINQMPVVESDRVVGIVTREGLLRVLRNQLEFGLR